MHWNLAGLVRKFCWTRTDCSHPYFDNNHQLHVLIILMVNVNLKFILEMFIFAWIAHLTKIIIIIKLSLWLTLTLITTLTLTLTLTHGHVQGRKSWGDRGSYPPPHFMDRGRYIYDYPPTFCKVHDNCSLISVPSALMVPCLSLRFSDIPFFSPSFYLGIVGSNKWQIMNICQVILQFDRSSLDTICKQSEILCLVVL